MSNPENNNQEVNNELNNERNSELNNFQENVIEKDDTEANKVNDLQTNCETEKKNKKTKDKKIKDKKTKDKKTNQEKTKRKNLLKNPVFGICVLILGLAMVLTDLLLPNTNVSCFNDGTVPFICPIMLDLYESADGVTYGLLDNYQTIYLLDEDHRAKNLLISQPHQYYEEITFDEDGNLYAVVSIYDEKDRYPIEERIVEYDTNGEFVRELASYDFSQTQRDYFWIVRGLNYFDGTLHYVESVNGEFNLVSYNVAETRIDRVTVFENKENIKLVSVKADANNTFIAQFEDGTCETLYADGSSKEIFASIFDMYENENGYVVSTITSFGNGYIAGLSTDRKTDIFYFETGESPKVLFNTQEVYPMEKIDYDEFLVFINDLSNIEGRLGIGIYDEYFLIDENSTEEFDVACGLPFKYVFNSFFALQGLFIGFLLTIFGIILGIGNLMKWRFTMVSKQIFATIPIVIIMFVVLSYDYIKQYDDAYLKAVTDKLMLLNEVAAAQIDVDEIMQMSNYDFVKDGRKQELEQQLYELLNHENGDGSDSWNKDIISSVYLIRDGLNGYEIANSNSVSTPFISTLELGDSLDEFNNFEENEKVLLFNGDTVVLYVGAYGTDEISAVTFLRDSAGNPAIMFVSDIGYQQYESERLDFLIRMILKAVGFLILLVLAVSLATYINIRRLKRAGQAITEIAAGNFSARIDRIGKDEVGQICGGVNEMAEKLEVHFEELDRNEKFYYKFVPEKFKELLHKESFTDLRLGDAESADLTVLFCDIRSFSLNSEMMTAKENFEFVNVIYGKAGPIIRKHKGFVDKYIGDAVMALFENADDAVAAGRELYQEIVLNPKTAEELGVQSINIGIGIHSGMARIGIVGEDERLSGTVISNTVNISSRLESLTKQYYTAMIITKETLDRLSNPDGLNIRYLGMIQVAGVNEVKALYEVLDCLDDARKNPRQKNAHAFREAIKAFHMGDPESAAEQLRKFDLNNENDPVPAMYLEYIEEKIAIADQEHNVFKFEKK